MAVLETSDVLALQLRGTAITPTRGRQSNNIAILLEKGGKAAGFSRNIIFWTGALLTLYLSFFLRIAIDESE